MRLTNAVIAASLAAAGLATPALADSFLQSLAKRAAEQVATEAVDRSVDKVLNEVGEPEEAGGGEPQPERQEPASNPAPAPTPRAWAAPSPINYPSEGVDRPSRFNFAPELQAQKRAFADFGQAPCDDCEGGFSSDGWVRRAKGLGGEGVLEGKIATMKLGQRLTWQGAAADGVLEIIGEEPIGPFPCKQVRYTLTRKRDDATAERLGLFCMSKAPAEAPEARWLELI